VATASASERFEAGDIDGAIAAAIAAVRAKPSDTGARGLLCELLCFDRDLSRVDKHLDLLTDQETDLAPAISLFRQVLRGETARREVFAEGRAPDFLDPPPEHLRLSLKALAALRAGDPAEALALVGAAEEARPKPAGSVDGTAFADWRDLDDITAGVLETITPKGDYYWVPLERVVHIAFDPPKRPRDLIWRQAHIDVKDGPDAVVYVPALYAGTPDAADDGLRLGRATTWSEPGSAPVRGLGLRSYLFDETDRTIMEIGEIALDAPAGALA